MCLSLQSLRCGGNGGVLPDRLDPNKHDRSIWAIVGTERRPNQMGWPGILCARDAGRSVAGGAALAGVHVGARTCCLAQRNQKTKRQRQLPLGNICTVRYSAAALCPKTATPTARRTAERAALVSLSGQRSLDPCGRHRQGTQTFAGQSGHRVGNGRGHRSDPSLTHPCRRCIGFHD